MRIVIHDFAGHAPQYDLAQELARRHNDVLYLYAADVLGPRPALDDSGKYGGYLRVAPLLLGTTKKYSYVHRLIGQRRFAHRLRERIADFQPDCVLSANSPTDVQITALRFCKRRGIPFVHWVTDFYSFALEVLLSRRFGLVGRSVALPFHILERQIFRLSDAVIYISEDFDEYARSRGLTCAQSCVIHTWAPLADIPISPKSNRWSQQHGLADKFVFMYCGTMGLKHNVQLVVQLADRFKSDAKVAIVVVSEGVGRDSLERQKALEGLGNIHLLDFQKHSDLSEVLATADVLFATVEADSGVFCVPSKVLAYCCAGRPILLLAPTRNLMARTITMAHAGACFEPHDFGSFLEAASRLRTDEKSRDLLGANARAYSEATFNIERIATRFLDVIRRLPLPNRSEPVQRSRG
jgi:colanic acid biosynthesis glycosyl transferase WcaI